MRGTASRSGERSPTQPLMTEVLADLALESEAATALALRLARAYDAPEGHADRALARLLTPAAKYWVCKRGPALAAEAMEVLGGNGYVEESGLAAAVPRDAGQLDLGRLGQRDVRRRRARGRSASLKPSRRWASSSPRRAAQMSGLRHVRGGT